jgi:hypothetical protein
MQWQVDVNAAVVVAAFDLSDVHGSISRLLVRMCSAG